NPERSANRPKKTESWEKKRNDSESSTGEYRAVGTTNDSFAEWLTRLRAGDDAAARAVFERFAHRLISLARRQFHASLKYKVDPVDVVQSAYKSFFRGFDERKFTVGNWDGLWGLLTLITVRKCADRVEYHRAECRDAILEAPVASDKQEGVSGM